MKILLVHNEYGRFSGEEAVFYAVEGLLRSGGHEIHTFVRSSASLPPGWRGKAKAFVSGIWSRAARRDMAAVLDEFQPEVVQIQNLFPLISPSVIGEIKRRGIPLVMACHNYRLFCPTGLMLRDGRPCSKCATGGVSSCIRHNCEGDLPRSIGYAVRNHVALRELLGAVDVFTVLSAFQRDRFVDWGIDAGRIAVVPNFIDEQAAHGGNERQAGGDEEMAYVGYAGRVSPEKGVDVLLKAALRLPEIPFRIAGHASRMPDLAGGPHVKFTGEIPSAGMAGFYRGARLTVAPSIWFEGMPMVVVEAMLAGRPVVASSIGGLTDMIVHGITGLLVPPGNDEALADAIATLWQDFDRCVRMGNAAREHVRREFNRERYYERLMSAYGQALRNFRTG